MLKKFTELSGVSSLEKQVREAILEEIKNYVTSYRVDAMGNLIVYKNAVENIKNPLTVILSAHMDEVGFIITKITDEGMLKFDTLGGIEPTVLVSKKVRCGGLNGVIGIAPIHLTSKEDREKTPEISDLLIDIGAVSKEDALKYVLPGDVFSFDSDFVSFGNNFVKAKALDDRLGCLALIDALKEDYECNIVCLFTVQEETGLRGAKAASFGIDADFAIVVEGTTAGDVTGVPSHMEVTTIDGGAALSIMDSSSIADKDLLYSIKEIAEENGIKIQYKKAATGGNDAGTIHTANGGIKTVSVSVPARYIHSPASVISLDDFYSVKSLVKSFLHSLKPALEEGEENND